MHSIFSIERDNGIFLSCHCWLPETSNALIIIVHGLGEHAYRYNSVARRLNQEGLAVYSFDLRGHGKSSGKRGHIDSFSTVHDDINAIACRARETVGDIPLFVYGHSLGGGIALAKWISAPEGVSGFIITSPWLELVDKKPPALIAASRVLKAFLPSFTLPTGLHAEYLSSDGTVVESYRNDPLVHGMISVETAVDAIDSAEKVLVNSGTDKPMLLAHGVKDRICSVEASRLLSGRSPGTIAYKEYDALHEIHNEPHCFEQLMAEISGFVSLHSGR